MTITSCGRGKMPDLYRKSSLDKLSDPEQLDRTIRITSPYSWLALLGVFLILAAFVLWAVFGKIPVTMQAQGILVSSDNTAAVCSDAAGTIREIRAVSGQTVQKGETVAILHTLTGEDLELTSGQSGIVSAVLCEQNETVSKGQEIFRLTPDTLGSRLVMFYVPTASSLRLQNQMRVLVSPVGTDPNQYGHMEGVIEQVGQYPVEAGNLWYVLGSDNGIAEQFLSQGSVTAVLCSVREDAASKNGFYWSDKASGDLMIPIGTFVTGTIIVNEVSPISRVLDMVS